MRGGVAGAARFVGERAELESCMARGNRDRQPDPLIDEIRAIREEMSRRVGNDVGRLIDSLKPIEAQHANRVVQPPTRPKGRDTKAG